MYITVVLLGEVARLSLCLKLCMLVGWQQNTSATFHLFSFFFRSAISSLFSHSASSVILPFLQSFSTPSLLQSLHVCIPLFQSFCHSFSYYFTSSFILPHFQLVCHFFNLQSFSTFSFNCSYFFSCSSCSTSSVCTSYPILSFYLLISYSTLSFYLFISYSTLSSVIYSAISSGIHSAIFSVISPLLHPFCCHSATKHSDPL